MNLINHFNLRMNVTGSLCLFSFVLLLTGCASQKRTDSFFFLQMADTQFGFFNENRDFSKETVNFEKAIAQANRLRPAFVVVCGDLVNKAGDAAQTAEYKRIAATLDPSIRLYNVPGNHDEFLREFCGLHFGDIEIAETTMHDAADGRRYLVMHGDAFDLVVRHARWLAFLGDWAYVAALALSTRINVVRRRLGFTYWSLSAWAKARVKNAVSFIGRFEETLAAEAKRHGVDGVICGHIHSAAMRDFGGFTYINTGDWVESCTAVVEHRDGRMEIIRWQEFSRVLNASRTPTITLPWRRAA